MRDIPLLVLEGSTLEKEKLQLLNIKAGQTGCLK